MHITENWDDERQRYVTVTKRPESLTEKASGGIDNDANTSPLLFSFLSPPPPPSTAVFIIYLAKRLSFQQSWFFYLTCN